VARLAPTYLPREPHATVLYRLVKEHGAEFLRYARESYDAPLPRYVEDELRGYLRCGDFSRGFVHLRCRRCEHDLLVPFSCKNRGLCPSCAGRRMAAQAAHLVDCILPSVPIRQFVLSFPFELSLLAATKPEVLGALARIHAEELARHYKSAAKTSGESGKLHAGAVTFVQRFGSSLNLHVHLHTCALDGVYVEGDDDAAPRFVPAAPPRRAELFVLTERVALRVMTWLRNRGYAMEDDHASNDTPDRSFAEVLAQVATQRGTLENVTDDTGESEGPAEPAAPRVRVEEAVTRHGFNMHASVTIAADDDLGRERLCRYGLRPPFSLARFRALRDGRISYRVKKSSRRISRCRIMTPIECIARLCALVPPPRYPLTRFHGVLAPRAKLRPRIVPRLPSTTTRPCVPGDETRKGQKRTEERPRPRDRGGDILPTALPVAATTLARVIPSVDIPAPNILSATHLGRIGGGLLYAATSRVPWATLLARTFEVDVKACAHCGGRLEVRAVVTDHDLARKILDALTTSARAPPSPDSTVAFEPAFA
jgi:Putative transposase/Transposase zinc-binding domain